MISSDKVIFGSNVRRFREALGMTQENLADTSELDRSYIGGVERGERNPTLTAILRLAFFWPLEYHQHIYLKALAGVSLY